MNTVPLKNEASLVACKRTLAKLYNTHSNMTLALRIEILEALGYGDEPELVGSLLSKQAYLREDGKIEYCVAEASRE